MVILVFLLGFLRLGSIGKVRSIFSNDINIRYVPHSVHKYEYAIQFLVNSWIFICYWCYRLIVTSSHIKWHWLCILFAGLFICLNLNYFLQSFCVFFLIMIWIVLIFNLLCRRWEIEMLDYRAYNVIISYDLVKIYKVMR